MNSYQLLADIYRVLGGIDRQTISAAERQTLDPQIKRVLRALADACSSRLAHESKSLPGRGVSDGPVFRHDEESSPVRRKPDRSALSKSGESLELVDQFLHLGP